MNTLQNYPKEEQGTIFDDEDTTQSKIQENPQKYIHEFEDSIFNDSPDALAETFNPDEESFNNPININEQSEKFDIFMKELKDKEEEKQKEENRGYLEKIWQNVSGLGIRGLEAVGGIPSDVKNFADMMLVDLPEYVTGSKSPGYRRFITGNPFKPGEEGYEEVEKAKGHHFPSSEEIRERITKPLTGQYFEPKDKDQKFYQNTIQDIVRFFAPGTSANRFTRLSPVSKVNIPIFANLGKQIAEDLDFSPTQSELIKMGLTLGLDLHGRANTRAFAGDMINRAERMVHPGQMMDARHLEHRMNQVEANLRRGGSSPETARALQAIQEVRDRIQNGQIEVADAMRFRERLNDVLRTGGGYDVPGASRPGWTRNIQRVKNRIVSAVDRELRNSNPEAARLWREGNAAYASYARSSRMGNWMRKQAVKHPLISNSLKLLMGPASYQVGEHIMHFLPKAAAAAFPMYGGIKAYQIITRSFQNPTIRRYYRDVMNAAMRENSLNYTRSLKKLDKAMKEQEAKDPLLLDLSNNQ